MVGVFYFAILLAILHVGLVVLGTLLATALTAAPSLRVFRRAVLAAIGWGGGGGLAAIIVVYFFGMIMAMGWNGLEKMRLIETDEGVMAPVLVWVLLAADGAATVIGARKGWRRGFHSSVRAER
jgi:hypothetical protein